MDPIKLLENESIQVILEENEDKILVLRQTDFEACYTKKNGQTFFG